MADAMFSVLAYLKDFVLTSHWKTIDLVDKISLPILYITGRKDEIVPTGQTQELYAASTRSRSTQIWINEDGHHNDTWIVARQSYLNTLIEFMDKSHQEESALRKIRAKEAAAAQPAKRVHKYKIVPADDTVVSNTNNNNNSGGNVSQHDAGL